MIEGDLLSGLSVALRVYGNMAANVCSPRAVAWAAILALSNGAALSSLHAF